MSDEPLAEMLRLMESDYAEAIRAGCDPHAAWESALEAGREFAAQTRHNALAIALVTDAPASDFPPPDRMCVGGVWFVREATP